MATKIHISDTARQILQQSALEGHSLRLPQQLDRATYEDVNKVIEALGGKWNKGIRCHQFPSDVQELLNAALDAGNVVKNALSYFPTPSEVSFRMTQMLDHDYSDKSPRRILEPSAGRGDLWNRIESAYTYAALDLVELDGSRADHLRRCVENIPNITVHETDFLTWAEDVNEPYDYILMNPPFALEGDPLAYITHIDAAAALLAPWGKLVAVAPAGFLFRQDKRCADFRRRVSERGRWQELPEGSFNESGTGVATVLILIEGSK